MNNTTKGKVVIEARVFRMGQKPSGIPKKIWQFMASKRIPFTGRWENLGIVSEGELDVVQGVVHTSPSSARS